jgi:hypothetical protein
MRMRWAGHVALIGEIKIRTKCWSEDRKGRDHSEVLDVDERIIIKWILGR